MSNFLENYGKALFVLVLMAILIAFAHPLGLKIKEYTTAKVNNTDKIGIEEITKVTSGKKNYNESNRPAEPKEAVDSLWCYLDKNGELVISQNQIIAPTDALVQEKQVKCKNLAGNITSNKRQIKTVQFKGSIKPKSCQEWFDGCENLTQIKNMENLYTNECTSMYAMFYECRSLVNIDISNFDTINCKNMSYMFFDCSQLTIDCSKWNISNIITHNYFNSSAPNVKAPIWNQ